MTEDVVFTMIKTINSIVLYHENIKIITHL